VNAVVLPTPVKLELQEVPAHAWEQSTAQHILSSSCWVESLHTDTAARKDVSVFQVRACRCDGRYVHPCSNYARRRAIAWKAGALLPRFGLDGDWGLIWRSPSTTGVGAGSTPTAAPPLASSSYITVPGSVIEF
jgi:hypothetical protein